MKVAMISDIHANIYALETVYAEIKKLGVEKIIVLGDLVGYYYWPKEVLDIIRNDKTIYCIKGNHELILNKFIENDPSTDQYRKKYGSGYDTCLNDLNKEDLAWLSNLPEQIEFEIEGHGFYLSHGSLNSIDEYLYPDSNLNKLEENYSNHQFTAFGHTHYPFLHTWHNKIMINPGSIGQPRDKGGLASYVILNLENHAIQFKKSPFNTASLIETAKKTDPKIDYLWKIMSR